MRPVPMSSPSTVTSADSADANGAIRRAQLLERLVRGVAVEDDDDLDVSSRLLLEDGPDGLADEDRPVVRGDDDPDPGAVAVGGAHRAVLALGRRRYP